MYQWIIALSLLFTGAQASATSTGNCASWGSGADSLEAIKHHVLYRDYIKEENFEKAFPFWEYVYQNAPGGSVKHFRDGITIYKAFYDKETAPDKKEEIVQEILDIYDAWILCFGNEGEILGKKVYDMFYLFQSDFQNVWKTAGRSIELEDKATSSMVLYPYAYVTVELFKAKKIDEEQAREAHKTINEIAAFNIDEDKYAEYYEKALASSNAKFDEIASDIFDCRYFLAKEEPNYQLTVYDRDARLQMMQRLRNAKCDENEDLVGRLVQREQVYSDSVRTANMGPADWFYRYFRDGDISAALEKYEEGSAPGATSNEDLYKMSMILAKHYWGDGNNKSESRKYALKAAKVDPNAGEPYLIIGNLYASSGPDCGPGTGWDSQIVVWAAIDKWQKCINVDPSSEAAAKARQKINEYTKYMPDKEQIHSRSLKEGEGFTVPCWIQERTTIRAYNPFK